MHNSFVEKHLGFIKVFDSIRCFLIWVPKTIAVEKAFGALDLCQMNSVTVVQWYFTVHFVNKQTIHVWFVSRNLKQERLFVKGKVLKDHQYLKSNWSVFVFFPTWSIEIHRLAILGFTNSTPDCWGNFVEIFERDSLQTAVIAKSE